MTKEQSDSLGEVINHHFANKNEVKVLEAGCGSATRIPIFPHYKMTGIDIAENQLARNEMLSEKICGDIQNYPLVKHSFDMIICWYVLEHLKYPEKAMGNFINALQTNGLIVIAVPNIWSVKGIVTKFTPLFVHVWFYRYIVKNKLAGKDGRAPHKTYLNISISPANMRQFAARNGLEVIHFVYLSNKLVKGLKQMNSIAFVGQMIVGAVLKVFSFGKIRHQNADFVVVFRKL